LSWSACGTTQPTTDDLPLWVGTAPHALQLKKVDEGTTYMRDLVEHIDPGRGVTAHVDHWKTPDNQTIDEPFLGSESKDALLAYLNTHEPPPSDHQVALEYTGRGWWRTHVVRSAVELDQNSIVKAVLHDDDGRDLVRLTFTPAATRAFGDLTSNMVGHKLAVMVDGTIVSAPIIESSIRGGQAEITFPTNTDAHTFAAAFGG
jgi:hypothetical protein